MKKETRVRFFHSLHFKVIFSQRYAVSLSLFRIKFNGQNLFRERYLRPELAILILNTSKKTAGRDQNVVFDWSIGVSFILLLICLENNFFTNHVDQIFLFQRFIGYQSQISWLRSQCFDLDTFHSLGLQRFATLNVYLFLFRHQLNLFDVNHFINILISLHNFIIIQFAIS